MKIMKSRKLLIGIVVACLLVGAIVAAVLIATNNNNADPTTGKQEETVKKEDLKVWKFDFSGYTGENADPGGYLSLDIVQGEKYTFSFDYCVVGETMGTTIINAAQAWGMGSNVTFTDNELQGKGNYTVSFTADWPLLYPVFQSHIAFGAPELYVWNLSLYKEGDDRNLISYVTLNHFKGDLAYAGLISLVDIDPDTLEGTVVEIPEDPVWLLDFKNYKGESADPSAYINKAVQVGKKYTFSFDYCVVGESTGVTVINAAKDWGMGSKVGFTNNALQGKGTYTFTFTADYPSVYPVFQCHTPKGAPELYIWNISLVEDGTDENMFNKLIVKSFGGSLAKEGLVSLVDINPSVLKGTTVKTYKNPTWLFDFSQYKGKESDPGAYTSVDVEVGSTYTFSFDYCVEGESLGTTVINAAKEWGMGSKVEFTNNKLNGKGTYTITFTADYPKLYPVFQTHVPYGTPKLYVWNMKLVKSGDNTNLFGEMTEKSFSGELYKAGLVSIVDIDTSKLTGTVVSTYENPTWLFDFSKYEGTQTDPGTYMSIDVEHGAKYTFSFDYCVVGNSTGTTVVNAAKEWGMGSKVEFTNNKLTGKGTYTVTFTADYPKIYPVFQTHIPYGAPELYVWNMKLVKAGEDTNLFGEMTVKSFTGELAKAGLVSIVDVDTDKLVGTKPNDGGTNKPSETAYLANNTWLVDFSKYEGTNTDPSVYFPVSVEANKKYTFSFDYCVVGESTGTNVINVKQAWGQGSNVAFTNNNLIGKGTYTMTFTADMAEIMPAMTSHIPYGAPELYVWNLSLVQEGTTDNILSTVSSEKFGGVLNNEGLVSLSDVDTDTLKPSQGEQPENPDENTKDVWLFDFENYGGTEANPSARTSVTVEPNAEYTFSFEYCVIGATTNTSVINVKQAWGLGSNVDFYQKLNGKGTYTMTFTADTADVMPAFQTEKAVGTPKLYVWDMKLVKTGTQENLLANKTVDDFVGPVKNEGLVSVAKMDPSTLEPTMKDVWKFDFANFNDATNTDPSARCPVDVEVGQEYTFSFDYFVKGTSTGTTVINAAQAWGLGSNIEFTNNNLTGEGTYTITFTADYAQVLPTFQTHTPYGQPELYVWNVKLVKTGTETNLLADKTADDFVGVMKNNGLVSVVEMDPSTLEQEEVTLTDVWKFDFANFDDASNTDPGARCPANVEVGQEYTFSFDYLVKGTSTGTTVINAAQAWGLGSNVQFTNNNLTGKGTYTFTFTADYAQVLPTFQTHTPYGAPELYVWNVKLVKTGTETNLLADKTADDFVGVMKNKGLVTVTEMDPSTLEEETVTLADVWKFDFANFDDASNLDPGARCPANVEVGQKYTFSFDYYVKGTSTGTTVINAAQAWGLGSNVQFTNNNLTGKGTYTITFTADYAQVLPTFQTHTPYGQPELYVWNVKLVKDGTETNLLAGKTADDFVGVMKNKGLVTVTEMDPSTLDSSNN